MVLHIDARVLGRCASCFVVDPFAALPGRCLPMSCLPFEYPDSSSLWPRVRWMLTDVRCAGESSCRTFVLAQMGVSYDSKASLLTTPQRS